MVECKICGKELNWIQNTHLAKHGITREDYKRMFPGAPLKSEKMTKILKETRWGDYKVPMKKCAREGCENLVHYKRKYCSKSCSSKVRASKENNPFKNPKTNPSYKNGESAHCKKQKRLAYKRDNKTCQRCGCDLSKGRRYSVHHIIPRRLFEDYIEADDLKNLITLCNTCHKTVESEFVDHIFRLYMSRTYKTLDELILYLKEKILTSCENQE